MSKWTPPAEMPIPPDPRPPRIVDWRGAARAFAVIAREVIALDTHGYFDDIERLQRFARETLAAHPGFEPEDEPEEEW